MSVDGSTLMFEGFLQKRKDTLVSSFLCSITMFDRQLETADLLSIEDKVGDVLVQASEFNFVLLHTEERQRCKYNAYDVL